MLDFAFTIGGQNVAGAARPLPVIDPSTGQPFTHSPAPPVAQLDQAVAAAAPAFAAHRGYGQLGLTAQIGFGQIVDGVDVGPGFVGRAFGRLDGVQMHTV